MSGRDYRGSARARGYTWQWEKEAKAYLREHPLCVMCAAEGRTVAASVVDHRIPHRGDQALFWDRKNRQGLCVHHHSAVKQREEALGYGDQVGADGWPTDPRHPANRTLGGVGENSTAVPFRTGDDPRAHNIALSEVGGVPEIVGTFER